jgi:hypothetical protein
MPDFDVQHPLDISSTTEANPGYPHGDILPNYTMPEKTERFRPIVGDVSVRTTHSTCPPSRFFSTSSHAARRHMVGYAARNQVCSALAVLCHSTVPQRSRSALAVLTQCSRGAAGDCLAR